MKQKNVNRSPLFYVGDKYKLIDEIKTHFPAGIGRFIEPFVGGGSVFMNVDADEYLLNDLDREVIGIHKYLCARANNEQRFFDRIFALIDSYGLSCSFRRDDVPPELKNEFPKTYYAKYNKDSFARLKTDFNTLHRRNKLYLYVLLIYGFNRMLRFNSNKQYNLPVGNVDFNANTHQALKTYFTQVRNKQINWQNLDFHKFFDRYIPQADDFIYLDPPYLITFSEYNKYWDEAIEKDLLGILDRLDRENIRFAISNVTHYKGRVNEIFLQWAGRFNIHPIKSNYISYHDNSIKTFNEVLVTNY